MNKTSRLYLYLALVQSIIATLGSLFFSEIMKYPPCKLCWFQRIAMYPLVAILTTGIINRDKKVVWYALPLVVAGFFIALYHNLLYYGILPQSAVPCEAGVSCTTRFFAWYGFITIPMLSLTAFTIIGILLFLFIKELKREQRN